MFFFFFFLRFLYVFKVFSKVFLGSPRVVIVLYVFILNSKVFLDHLSCFFLLRLSSVFLFHEFSCFFFWFVSRKQ